MRRAVLIAIGLTVLAIGVAVVSRPLLLLLLAGAILGVVATYLVSLPNPRQRALGLGALALFLVSGGLLVVIQSRTSRLASTEGPFRTSYGQDVVTDGEVASVEDRYVIEADPGVTIERIVVPGTGLIETEGEARVEDRAVIPDGSSVAFRVTQNDLPIARTSLGFRSWRTSFPILRATVVFRRPEDSEAQEWAVVRCRELAIQLYYRLTGGQLVAGVPGPDRLTGDAAEWRNFAIFDRTDPAPEVTLLVDQAPAPLRAMRAGGRLLMARFYDQLLATIVGTTIGSLLVPTVRNQWTRVKKVGTAVTQATAAAP